MRDAAQGSTTIGSALARRMIAAARSRAEALGHAVSICIVDAGGSLKALHRMDGSTGAHALESEDKAISATGNRLGTDLMFEMIKGDAPLRDGAPAALPRLNLSGGGYPIMNEGILLGGIGISGSGGVADMRIAEAALAEIADGASVARQMARFVIRTLPGRGVPAAIRREALRAIVNCLGASLAACGEPAQAALLQWATDDGPASAPVRMLWVEEQASAEKAALFNGACLHLADFDDTHIPTVLHATAPVLGALIAESQRFRCDGMRFLDAFIAGVETATAVALMLMPTHSRRGFHVTAVAGTVGAAVAAGALRRLDEDQLTHAINIAAHSASGLKEHFGSMAKCLGVGQASMRGLSAVRLAVAGLKTAESGLEGRNGLVRAMSDVDGSRAYAGLSALGARWHVRDLALKRFPTGVAMHAPLDAAIEASADLSESQRVSATRLIFTVDPLIEQHWRLATGPQKDGRALEDPLQAKFSFKYCVAYAWLFGTFDLHAMDPSHFEDRRIADLMTRVEIVGDPTVTMIGSRIEVILADGQNRRLSIDHHRGSPGNRLSDDEINSKFFKVNEHCGGLDRAALGRIIDSLWRLDACADVSTLWPLLRIDGQDRSS